MVSNDEELWSTSTVKDVEANAEREWRTYFGTDPGTGKPVSVRLGNLVPWLKLEMLRRRQKIC
jgi:hypothetical protein